MKAGADKLKREIEDFGFPPQFPSEEEQAAKKQKEDEWEEPQIKDKSKGKKVCS